MLQFLKYGEYCAGLPQAQITLDTLCTKDMAIAEEIDRCEDTASKRKYKLREMLIVPMQRILKYHLLLNVMANCPTDFADEQRSYELAYQAMVDVAEFINEVKR